MLKGADPILLSKQKIKKMVEPDQVSLCLQVLYRVEKQEIVIRKKKAQEVIRKLTYLYTSVLKFRQKKAFHGVASHDSNTLTTLIIEYKHRYFIRQKHQITVANVTPKPKYGYHYFKLQLIIIPTQT